MDVPTLAGTVGVLAKHVPTIGVLKPGVVDVTDNEGLLKDRCVFLIPCLGKHLKVFVSSGTFSMNIDGSCQVLAEEIVEISEIDESVSLSLI